MKRGIFEISDSDDAHKALKSFLQGRYRIETSWDYSETYRFYDEASSFLSNYRPNPGEEGIVFWLQSMVKGHRGLQEAEASWTLCNFEESREAYLKASKSFAGGLAKLSDSGAHASAMELSDYSRGWEGIASGMYHNMIGDSLLRSGRPDEATAEFTESNGHLIQAQQHFGRIGNLLGIGDSKSYIVDPKVWVGQEILISEGVQVRWSDYAFFDEDLTFERILAKLDSVAVRYPSELITRSGAEELRLMTANLGSVTLSRLGDSQLPSLDVKITFHLEHVIQVEYALRLAQPVDPFMLYLLKILNTDAVPAYEANFASNQPGLSFELKNCRLKDLTRRILVSLANSASGKGGLTFLDSFVTLCVYDYRPKVEASELGGERFRYMRGFFSEAETLTLQPNGTPAPIPDNLFRDVQSGNVAMYLTAGAAVMIVPEMQEWERNMYSDALEYVLATKETASRVMETMGREADVLGTKLEVLRKSVVTKSSVSQQEIRDLISNNIEIRLRALRLIEIQRRHDLLKQGGIRDVRTFVTRAEEKVGVLDVFQRAGILSERIEALYDTAFNLGQDYLSLVIAINSDVSSQAFSVLNIVMMGSLGLAVVTAILGTPIGYTFAGVSVFATSLAGYLYLIYVRHRAGRFRR